MSNPRPNEVLVAALGDDLNISAVVTALQRLSSSLRTADYDASLGFES